MKHYLLFFCAFLITQNLEAQAYNYWNIPIIRHGDTLKNGGNGGASNPQYSSIDINNDNTLDLLIYDRSGQIAQTYLNTGQTGEIAYQYAPQYQDAFPQGSINFMLARDYNCDGIEDLFYIYQPDAIPAGIRVLRGHYDANQHIQFTETTETLFYLDGTVWNELQVINTDLPAIDDVDADGDLDILAFSNDGFSASIVYFYKNMSAENGYGCDSLQFTLATHCWGKFSESNLQNGVFLSPRTDSCANNPWYSRTPRHSGSTITTLDWNGDGAKDMLMGDVSCGTLNMLTSELINDTILVIAQDSIFPSYNTPVNLYLFPAAYILDVDNDGKLDMLAAINDQQTPTSIQDSVTHFYKNIGSNTNMQFALQQTDFGYREHLDLGISAYPTFVDYNQDGLLNLVVGNELSVKNQAQFISQLTLLLNVGTSTNPVFEMSAPNLANLNNLGFLGLYPSFGDLDGDSDLDLLVGTADGVLIYVENIAMLSQQPIWAIPVQNFAAIDINSNIYPQLVDIDRDGDLDIMAGSSRGNIYWFENTGNATNPIFSSTETSATIGMIDTYTQFGSRKTMPFFYDNQGEMQLFLGHELGRILHYHHIDNNLLGTYDTLSSNYNNIYTGLSNALSIGDVNQDDSLDIVVGNIRGGLSFFTSHTIPTNNSILQENTAAIDISVYPNPSNGLFQVAYATTVQTSFEWRVYNLLGVMIASGNSAPAQSIYTLPLQHLPQGIYILEGSANDQIQYTKIEIR